MELAYNSTEILQLFKNCTRIFIEHGRAYIWQIECGLAWSVLFSITIRVITVVKMLWTHEARLSPQQILTTVMTRIVVDKSTDHVTTFDLFSTTIPKSKKCCFQSESWKRYCATHSREQRGMDSYWQRQISQSDCEIRSNCGKNSYRPTRAHVVVHLFYISLLVYTNSYYWRIFNCISYCKWGFDITRMSKLTFEFKRTALL